MGKGRDRGPRRRDFEDDDYFPPPPPFTQHRAPQSSSVEGSGPTLEGTVKWFNSEKGFGFVELADGSGDVFLHIAVVQAAGHDDVAPGARLRVQVGQGQKGRQITSLLGVEAPDPNAAPPQRQSAPRGPAKPYGGRERVDHSTAVSLDGTVKWYKAEKGFGFVVADDGQKDVFVHARVLERAGMSTLAEGQRLAMQVVSTPKGREAISVEAID